MQDIHIQVVYEPHENWLIVPLGDDVLLLNRAMLGIQRAPFSILEEITKLCSPNDSILFETKLDVLSGSDLEQFGQEAFGT